jgi:nicotinamidase-related amidase
LNEMTIKIEKKVNLDSQKTAIIVVDMQKDFVYPEGRLYVPQASKTIQPIRKLVEKGRSKGVPIIYTQDWHIRDDPEFGIWGKHAEAGSWGAEIVDELKPTSNDIVIKKTRYDAFYGTPLDDILRNVLKRDTLVIVGTVANICVLHTVGSAALRWYKTVVPIDGISALNDYDMRCALRQMDFLYKTIVVESVDEIFFT